MTRYPVLIVDPSRTVRTLLRREFDSRRFEVFEADDGAEAIRLAGELGPIIVTVSAVLPTHDGAEVCEAITSHPSASGTSVIMITSLESEEERRRAFEAGVVRFFDKSFPEGELAVYVDQIMQARGRLADTGVLVVDDSAFIRSAIARVLAKEGATVLQAENGRAGLTALREHDIDVILTDYHMPVMDGFAFVRALRDTGGHASTPVLLLSSSEHRHMAVRALDAGANDFIHKPFEATELLARVRSFARLAAMTKKLELLATTDELTGLLNRRQALCRLEELAAAANRYDVGFSCVLLDIDHFKRFNDTYGHAVGDRVLREVAGTLRQNVRATDTVCRIGGEEFLVLCPHVDAQSAAVCAEKLRSMVEAGTLDHDGTALRVTISLGVAEYDQDLSGTEEVLKVADDALYVAKRSGRNAVYVGTDGQADRYDPARAACVRT